MTRKEILETAEKMVCGHREQDYGSPEDSFNKIAALWTAYKGVNFDSIDVSMMMALLKIARISSGTATDDSFVDLAGYAACGGECKDALKPKVTYRPLWEEERDMVAYFLTACPHKQLDEDFTKLVVNNRITIKDLAKWYNVDSGGIFYCFERFSWDITHTEVITYDTAAFPVFDPKNCEYEERGK